MKVERSRDKNSSDGTTGANIFLSLRLWSSRIFFSDFKSLQLVELANQKIYARLEDVNGGRDSREVLLQKFIGWHDGTDGPGRV